MDGTTLIDELVARADGEGWGTDPVPVGVAGLTAVRSRRRVELGPLLYQPMACLVLQGAKEAALGGPGTVRFGHGQTLVVTLDLPTSARIVEASDQAPYLALALELDVGLLREIALDLPDERLGGGGSVTWSVGRTDPAILDGFVRLLSLAGDPAGRRLLDRPIRREIHARLLLAQPDNVLGLLARTDQHGSAIAAAANSIRTGFAQPFTVDDLARSVGLGRSAFFEHFRSVVGMTPVQYQKRIRLHEGQRRLRRGAASVAEVAYHVGYASPSQFSRDYRRHFGVAPRDERAAVGPAAPQAAAIR